jgi:hypothetical protein
MQSSQLATTQAPLRSLQLPDALQPGRARHTASLSGAAGSCGMAEGDGVESTFTVESPSTMRSRSALTAGRGAGSSDAPAHAHGTKKSPAPTTTTDRRIIARW